MRLVKNNLLAALLCILALGCGKIEWLEREINQTKDRLDQAEEILYNLDFPPKKVMILLSNGHNNLSTYLKDDIEEMKSSGYVPDRSSSDYLFIISKSGPAGRAVAPVLTRLYRTHTGAVVADTVYRREIGTVLADAAVLGDFLTYIKKNYPAASYGMVVSSHATGWLPADYYAHPEKDADHTSTSAPTVWELMPSRTITSEGTSTSISEIELSDFVAAIPMHLEYLIIDACLCGVETAYAFKDVADYFGCSLTEVMADGFDYETLAHHLLEKEVPDPAAVCKAFIDYYTNVSPNKCASIALYESAQLPLLASICQPLFEEYREQLSEKLDWKKVQGYFGGDKHWFFDLRHALEEAGATFLELSRLDVAMDACLVYKGTTGKFYSGADKQYHDITHFSGISMYLPCAGTPYLNSVYRNLDWNEATGLVE